MNIKLFEQSFKKTDHDTYTLEIGEHAKMRLMKHLTRIDKLEMKLKMMEISFEQTNNSRNDLLRQLAITELRHDEVQFVLGLIKKELDKRYHYAVAESIRKILKENVVAEAS